MTGSTHANHRSARSPRATPEGPARDNPIAGPRTCTTRSEPRAPASAGASGRHKEPGSRLASTCPAQPPSKSGGASPGMGKAPRRRESRPEHRERQDRTRRGAPMRGHKARQRGRPPATTTAHAQVPSNNGHQVPQTRAARTTRNKPQHRRRCRATANPHTTNPSQQWRGTSGARTQTRTHPKTPARSGGAQRKPGPKHTHPHHTPQPGVAGYKRSAHTNTHTRQHPSQEWRGAAKTRAQAHTPTPYTPARSGGEQAERAHKHTHTPTPQPGVAGRN